MIPRPAAVLLVVGALATIVGIGLLVRDTLAYLGSSVTPSSTSGLRVFRVDGILLAFAPYQLGFEPLMIGAGVVILVAGVIIAAIWWRPKNPDQDVESDASDASRASTAVSNVSAHTL